MEAKDVTAVITGGASGLGEAAARELVSLGARVALLDLDTERGEVVEKELGSNARFYKTDITDEIDVQAAIGKTVQTFGGIQAVLCCAGIATPGKVIGKRGLLPMEQFEKVVRVNLFGTMIVNRIAAQTMLVNKENQDREKGVIINTASIAAFEGQIGQAAYAASKAAVVGLTLPLAREFASQGIRVVTIAPGLFNTPMLAGLPERARESLAEMMPFPKRLGHPNEFAMLCRHIIENPMLNGETIRLDAALRMAAR